MKEEILNNRLLRALAVAEIKHVQETIGQVCDHLKSLDADERLIGLLTLQLIVEGSQAKTLDILNIANRFLNDIDEDCRWQAAILIGLFIEESPESVWRIIQEHGISDDSEMQTIIATTLIEHLLEFNGSLYWPKMKDLVARSPIFKRTLSIAWVKENSTEKGSDPDKPKSP